MVIPLVLHLGHYSRLLQQVGGDTGAIDRILRRHILMQFSTVLEPDLGEFAETRRIVVSERLGVAPGL